MPGERFMGSQNTYVKIYQVTRNAGMEQGNLGIHVWTTCVTELTVA
jgi:hypothetical protein